LKGFQAIGCQIVEKDGFLFAEGSNLHGAEISLNGDRGTTTTGTMNVVMAALGARGETVIYSAAIEPEVVDLCDFLVKMGAKIEGVGTPLLKIHGGNPLHGCEHTIIGDRMEAGTFVCAGLATESDIRVLGLEHGLLDPLLGKLEAIGANVVQNPGGEICVKSGTKLAGTDVVTGPYPGFPTDLQAQFCVLLTQSSSQSTITENIYPERFFYALELKKMGALLDVIGPCAHVAGNTSLVGGDLQATDLRASAALYLAGLCAKGETIVRDIYHLDRGYEDFEGKLASLGAQIRRI
jgi:UDP-N-acetylglucosamine 1-carboxyvinyltransferase